MKHIIRLLGLLLLLSQQAKAQDVIVTVQVLPPYSTYLPDYLNNPSKIIFSLMSTTTRDVKIKATITGDNGISVATSPSGSAATPIHLIANQVKMMNGTNLKAYLDVNSVVVSGIDKNRLYRGNGLPEGNYTVCLQVLDYATGSPLSQAAPTGCSAPIQIQQINPPQLIAPVCDATITGGTMPQNVIFTWLPAPGVKPGTQYRLKIVELVPITRNPNEAMNSATTPAFFETTVSTFSYLYGPAQPALKNGKKYAWRVTAVEPGAPPVNRSNFQNNGNSEVCSFVYEKTTIIPNSAPAYGITLLKPIKGEHINNGYGLEFSWTASKKTLKSYEVQFTNSLTQDQKITNWASIPENLFSRKDSFMASKDVGNVLSNKLPGSWTNGKGKIAWRIIAKDQNGKAVDSSKIETYELVDAPLAERIKLVSPIQGKKIVSGYGLKFEWESSKKISVSKYQLQFTNMVSSNKKITDWNNISEKLFSNKDAAFASKDTKDLFVDLPNEWTTGVGKIAWRVIGISYGIVIDSSKIETYEVTEDTGDVSKINAFMMGGYVVKVAQFSDKNPDNFGGSGSMYLWEGGKEVPVYFKGLKIRPFSIVAKTQQKIWTAIQGTMDVEVYKKLYGASNIKLEPAADCDGSFELALNTMKITANIEGTTDATTQLFKITKDSSHAEGFVKGKWLTNFFIPNPPNAGSNLYEYESAETSIKMTFADKFDGTVNLKADKKMEKQGNGKIDIEFGSGIADMELKVKGLNAEISLSGTVTIPNASPSNSGDDATAVLAVPFKNQKNLNFAYTLTNPLQWKLNKDGSVVANVTQLYVHLSETGALDSKFKNYPYGLNFDKFGVTINLPKKAGSQTGGTMGMSFSNIYNKGEGYGTLLKNEFDTKSDVNIAGFTSKLNKTEVLMNKNKLISLYVQGNLYVPFINDWRPVGIDIDNEKIEGISVDFDYDKKYYLNKSDGEIYITLSSGRLENNAVVISPKLVISQSQRKGVETKELYMCEMYIDPNGAVSFSNNFADNSVSTCEGSKYWATYYKFDYNIDKIKIKRNTIKTDAQFVFSGDLTLAPGISATSKKEAGFLYHGPKPDPGTSASGSSSNAQGQQYNTNYNSNTPVKAPVYKGPALDSDAFDDRPIAENTVEITDDKLAVQGGYEDGGQKFGGGFKLVQDDPTWGDYFELGGYYETKEPVAKQLEMKFILGKKPKIGGTFSYWYFDFYQKGYVTIPVIPGIVEVSGFGGKAYCHMGLNYDNQGNVTSLAPDKSKSLGIAAIANVRTAYDQGMTVHGKATIVTQFEGWSLDGIHYYIKGDAISTSESSTGLLQARMNGSLNWADKFIDGKGQIWGNVKDLVCLNEGQANEDSVGFHFGTDDFYVYVGKKEAPITAEILCGNGWSTGVWFQLSKTSLGLGLSNHYDSGWKGLDLGVASAKGKLVADLSAALDVNYSPFQATGTVAFHGAAYGKGCIRWVGCVGGSCSADANLTISMPDPVLFKGSVRCDVSRWIPDFTLNAAWSSKDGFSISL